MSDSVEVVYDKRGIPIERGDVVKVFHFVGARNRRHYMFKQCLGLSKYRPDHTQRYVFFSHLNLNDELGSRDGPYHEWPNGQVLDGYEIVQSVKCDHETRPRVAKEPTP